jgi:phosphatidylserine decarboxylase
MRLAREGIREMLIATLVLGAAAVGLGTLHWTAAILPVIVWIFVISFFRDPARQARCGTNELCAAADGTVTEVTQLEHDETIGGPALRVGVFLSIFDVHANRAPCSGLVRSVKHQPGRFLDARNPDSGALNESTSMVLEPDPPMPGPVIVRQVAGLIARRIICHAGPGDHLSCGERYGMIKFGSRTELIIPALSGTEITVMVGDKTRAGLTLVARQPVEAVRGLDAGTVYHESHSTRRARSPA